MRATPRVTIVANFPWKSAIAALGLSVLAMLCPPSHAATRQVLTASATYYVRSDGNDACNGLTNASGSSGNCAFLTWAHALVVITETLDFGGQTVTIFNGNGATYTDEIFINNAWIGGGDLVIDLGGGGIAATTGHKAVLAFITQPGNITVQNGTLSAVTFSCLQNAGIGTLAIGTGLTFGNCGEYHIEATSFGAIIGGSGASYTVSGSAGTGHIGARSGGTIFLVAATATFTSDFTASSAFAVANDGGLITADPTTTFTLGGHTVSGPRFAVTQGGIIDTLGGGTSFFPGSSPGTMGIGGIYDGVGRQFLLSAATYYVRSDGNDPACTGVTNAAYVSGSYPQNCGFATWAKGVATVTGALDFGGQTVTISNGNGASYTTGPNLNSSWVGGGSLVIDLGGGTINQTSGPAVWISAPEPGAITVQNGTLNTGGGSCLVVSAAAQINIGSNLTFGTTGVTGYHMYASSAGGLISSVGVNYSISGAAGAGHMQASVLGAIYSGFNTVTVSANLVFSNAFASATRLGLISTGATTFNCPSSACPSTFTVTGPRYQVDKNSIIDTSGGGANFFPGNAAGTTATGGQYF
jgi:hypothetical protein